MYGEGDRKLKEYPLKDGRSKILNICECGHPDFYHGVDRDDCHACGCPTYKFEQNLTTIDSINLEKSIRLKNRKRGYST